MQFTMKYWIDTKVMKDLYLKYPKKQLDKMRKMLCEYYCTKYKFCHNNCPLCRDDKNEIWCCICNQNKTTYDELLRAYIKMLQKNLKEEGINCD